MNLDEVATSLRVRFPKCKEQVDKELARIRAEQQELAARGESDDSVDMRAADFTAYIQNLPCAEHSHINPKPGKGAKRGRLRTRRSNRR